MVAITIQGNEDCQRRRIIDELFSSLTTALVTPGLTPFKKPKIVLLNSFFDLG